MILGFQKISGHRLKQPENQPEYDDADDEGHVILCANCRSKITSAKQRIEIYGDHHHVFANPSGIVFDIGCFSLAPGCANHGIPTSEFTWFSGFAWRFSICGKCHLHLGWHYTGGSESFYGLILANLIEET